MSRRLLTGGTVWAGAACAPRSTWLLVDDDRVGAVGHETGTTPPPPADQLLDLSGCHVLPGFVDVHLHLSQAAWFPLGVDASGWRGLADALRAVRVTAAAAPDAPWLLFWSVARWRWPEGRLPTAGELDEAAPGRRVLVSTLDMHRGAAGVQAALQGEANRCLAYGITHAHDPYVSPEWHQRMLALHASTLLRLSWGTGSVAGMHSRAPGPAAAPDGSYGDSGREVKLFADGGDRCALRLPTRALVGLLGGAVAESWRLHATGPLREALRRRLVVRPRHLDAPYLRYTDTELASLVAEYANAGVRLRIHALGNLAGAQAARVLRGVGVPPGAATIDHLLLLDPATADHVASTGVPVSYQPGFLPRYGTMLQAARADRYVTVLGGRLLLQAGVPLALSSDHPCGSVDPLHNLRAAVERRLPGGQQLQPEQALTRTEAVRAATVNAATSLQAPGGGGLAPGQAADLVICDGDPFQEGTRVTQTWIGGKLAWQAPEATGGRPSTPTRR